MQGEWTVSNDYGQLWGLSIEVQCKQGFACVQIRFRKARSKIELREIIKVNQEYLL